MTENPALVVVESLPSATEPQFSFLVASLSRDFSLEKGGEAVKGDLCSEEEEGGGGGVPYCSSSFSRFLFGANSSPFLFSLSFPLNSPCIWFERKMRKSWREYHQSKENKFCATTPQRRRASACGKKLCPLALTRDLGDRANSIFVFSPSLRSGVPINKVALIFPGRWRSFRPTDEGARTR